MKKLRLALILIFICIFGIYFFHNSFAADSTVAKEKGGKITASDKKSSSHPTTEISMTCSECHEVDYDAKSTATRMWINNYKQMTRDEIWKKIADFLPYRQRFVMATVGGSWWNPYPTATTADFTLVPDEHIIICSNEKGTEKLAQLKKNPYVSLVHFEGSIEGPIPPEKRWWKSVQIFGKATMFDSDAKEFDELGKKYVFYRVQSDRAKKRMVMTKVDIERVIYFDSSMMKEGFSPYQLWENPNFKK